MAIAGQIKGKRVYFDTNVFIYIFEGSPGFQNIVKPIIELAENEQVAPRRRTLIISYSEDPQDL